VVAPGKSFPCRVPVYPLPSRALPLLSF